MPCLLYALHSNVLYNGIMEHSIVPTGYTPQSNVLTCQVCHILVNKNWYFCPNCGKKLKSAPLSTSAWKQFQLYLVCIFLPPFGLILAFRYIFNKSNNAKLVGLVCLLLTILSSILTIWVSLILIQQINTELNHALTPLPGLQYNQKSSNTNNSLNYTNSILNSLQ